MKNLFLAAIVTAFLFLATYQPKIFIGNENSTVAVVDYAENTPVTINFIHSVQKTPVIEELRLQGGEFTLVRTKYKSQGVGLPFDASDGTFYRDNEWFIFDMDRKFPTLELRTGKGTNLTVTVADMTFELYKILPVGSKIIVKTF